MTQHIAEDNPGVENLSVTVENGVANIQGVASTAAALEKAVLMAGKHSRYPLSNERCKHQ